MSALTAGIDAALTDAFATAGQTFAWNGQDYDCVLNAEQNALVTSKSLFARSGFPIQGDIIRVAGKDRQVEGIANSIVELIPGGSGSDTAFVDDPANPSLIISFSSFIGK